MNFRKFSCRGHDYWRIFLNKHDRIFSYRSNNKYYTVKASDVNKYLKQFGKFSAKNFRTWTANVDIIKELQKPETNLRKHLTESIKKISIKRNKKTGIKEPKKNKFMPLAKAASTAIKFM